MVRNVHQYSWIMIFLILVEDSNLSNADNSNMSPARSDKEYSPGHSGPSSPAPGSPQSPGIILICELKITTSQYDLKYQLVILILVLLLHIYHNLQVMKFFVCRILCCVFCWSDTSCPAQ